MLVPESGDVTFFDSILLQPITKSTYFSDSVYSVLNMKTFLDKNNVHKKTTCYV